MGGFVKTRLFFLAKNIFTVFITNMSAISKLKTYLTTPSKCYIPKCKAICCAEAPIPIDFLPKHKDKVTRKIFEVINFGKNDPRDTFDSVIFNTTGNPIRVLGIDQNGQKIVGIPREIVEKMQLKSQEQIEALINHYKKYKHYCPFLTDFGRCNVYSERPPICREFGTSPEPINKCPEKATPLEILKDKIQFQKEVLKNMWKLMCGKKL